jgi:hypothetical protein
MIEAKIEVTVRTIHTGEQYVPALCERVAGSERVWCLYGNVVEGVQAVEISVRDHDHATESIYKGERYPVARLQDALMQISLRGMVHPEAVEVASRLLPGFRYQVPPADDSEPIPDASKQPTLEGRPNVLAGICLSLKIDPADARKRLRATGLRAPYVDVAAIRRVLEGK